MAEERTSARVEDWLAELGRVVAASEPAGVRQETAANIVPSTPKLPAVRLESVNQPPSGERRRRNSFTARLVRPAAAAARR